MAVYTDSFTGVDGTDLPDHDANWVDAGDARPLEIQSNEVTRVTPGGNFSGVFYNQTFNSKHYSKLKITAARFIGPGIRMATGKNYYYDDGVLVATYTGKTALTGGRPGITCYGVDDPTGDDWEGGDVGGGTAVQDMLGMGIIPFAR